MSWHNVNARLTLHGQPLDGSALSAAVVGGQGVSLDAAASTHAAGENVVGVQVITSLCLQTHPTINQLVI